MSGDLLALARREASFAVNTLGFQEDISLSTPDNSLTIEVKGLASKHWIGLDDEGMPTNTKNAHITVVEADLTALSYPVRNANNEVLLYGHKVNVPDSTGVIKSYVVKEQYPNETLGLIALLLGDYRTS